MSETLDTSESLQNVLESCWAMLEAGVRDRRTPFHLPTLCTVAPDTSPSTRVVVLREANPESRVLRCHTDKRSSKVEHIQANDRVAWLFYDPSAMTQIRLNGRAKVHAQDEIAKAAWESSQLTSRRCYLAPAAPGSAADAPSPNLPEEFRSGVPSEDESAPGFENFAVIRTIADEIDWLHLGSRGHRRAKFAWGSGEKVNVSTWAEP
ncbi:MAG: pyridoxamine 5'-phosphate oxidase family protein [Planctomycetota bacterium]